MDARTPQGDIKGDGVQAGPSIDGALVQGAVSQSGGVLTSLPTLPPLTEQQLDFLGLPNLGQSCYLNSALQSLLTLGVFSEEIEQMQSAWSSLASAELLRDFVAVRASRRSGDLRYHFRPQRSGTMAKKMPMFLTCVLNQDEVNDLEDQLLCYNDLNVSQTTGRAVHRHRQRTAYLLFYQRQRCPGSAQRQPGVMGRSKNVHIMCYPSHTTHALQPADKALFKSLKHHWDQEGRKWTRMMAGQKLSRMEFFPVFSRAWAKAATVENVQAGFRGTGMFPLNKDVLPETAFAPSKTTERVLPSTLPSLHTRPQCLLSPPTRPPPLPPLPTGPRSPLLTMTHSAHQPLALLSGHQPSHLPARPQSPADLPARPQSSASLTPLLPVEPLYFFPDEKVVFEEVVLEEDTDLFNAFTPQEETHSQDEEPSTSTSMRSVKFSDLISVPHRERAIRKRAKPPSYNLTSEQHIEYITSKISSSKQPAKQASKYPGNKQPKGKGKPEEKRSKTPCKVCKAHYGDPNDLKAADQWVKRDPCSAWFHENLSLPPPANFAER
ncbi:hypothetical protein N1851_026357 [Merluccius polli]|uniref:DDE-1 domain-containing protein n=1 Tax=Merluccius polli TaxID=89951 RepID=A0AA47MCA3_MERPO|nr:hypothetical protein N1851_026357 [Merluccius polli]